LERSVNYELESLGLLHNGEEEYCGLLDCFMYRKWVLRSGTQKAVMKRLKEAIAYFREAYETKSCIYSPAIIIEEL